MARRRLTPETIIPAQLYVERQADRDLERIVDEMGRPGYVLVARQMGKTNLLLHMKSRREAAGDFVVYFDLSNRFETLREQFQWIVDGLLEYGGEQLDIVRSTITEQRSSTSIAPHIEYDRHLRLILREIPDQRIVIVLDEVDSLSHANFSNAFWAQVRSMYFARANYGEYKRLTYALSGVAEPSDLIRDKSISPFNIGEKIYLEDFSRSEIQLFSDKAELKLSSDVLDRIYEWTGGNPRMTWDACAALESLGASAGSVNVDHVDAAIDRLYLNAFDRAPVDHIRDLVQSDQLLRDAIVTVRYGKGDTLDARARSKLYLAGITRAAELSPVIKNKVIDIALSDEWLAQVSRDEKSLPERAVEAYKSRRYSDAIALFETWRQQDGNAPLIGDYRVVLAAAHYALGDSVAAAAELRSAMPTIDSQVNSQWAKFLLAASLLRLGDTSESLPLLEELSETTGSYQNSARQALAAALATTSPAQHKDRVIKLSQQVIDALRSDSDAEQRDELVASSYSSMAQVLLASDDIEGARTHLELAEASAPEDYRPEIMLSRLRLLTAPHERAKMAERAAEAILDSGLQLPDAEGGLARFQHKTLSTVILRLIQNSSDRERTSVLVAGLLKKLLPDRTPFEGLLELFRRATETDKPALVLMLAFALREFSLAVLRDTDALDAHRGIARFAPEKDRGNAVRAYLSIFRSCMRADRFNEDDVIIFMDFVSSLNQERKFSEASDTLNLLDPYWVEIAKYSHIVHIVLLSFKLTALQGKRDVISAKVVAQEIVDLGNSAVDSEGEYSTELASTRRHLINQAQRYVGAYTPDPYRHLGRNERVVVRRSDAQEELSMKFKHAESDLRTGRLILLRRGK